MTVLDTSPAPAGDTTPDRRSESPPTATGHPTSPPTTTGPREHPDCPDLHPAIRQRIPRPSAFFRRPPRPGTTLAVAIGTLISLAPNLLPRTPGAQAILTALLVLLGLAVAGVWRWLLGRRIDVDARFAAWRVPLAVLSVALIAVAAVRAGHWQNGLREAMGTPPIGPGYWVRWAVGATVVVAVCLGAARGVGWVVRALGRVRASAVGVAAALAVHLVIAPAVVDGRRAAYAAADAVIDPGVDAPLSSSRSGSAESAVPWATLGAQGRRFVAQAPAGPTTVYVGLGSAPDPAARVALAVRELERSGGFERAALVLAIPTGSGWIDSAASEGLARRFGSEVAVVGVQYSAAPSWVSFVFGRAEAIRVTRALVAAVERALADRPHRPKLFVYGQSLGATAGSAVFADDADQRRRTCAVLWAGPPGGAVHRGGATVLANSSDPVVRWSVPLLWRSPDLRGVRRDAPVPAWLPVVGFVQTTADLVGALDAPRGHGHRYGTDQGTALGDC